MKRFVKTLLAWFIASLFAYLLASLVATQSVVSQLAGMGIPISLGERLQMSARDLVGMVQMFLPLIAAGFLVALSVAGLLGRYRPDWRAFLFPLAGFVALVSIHLALEWAFDISLIAVARSTTGLLLQGLAGAAGGWLFTRLKPLPAPNNA
jgi:hypothetical protein